MTTQKDFKRLVRRRMQKTGEAYTTARTHLVRRPPKSSSTSPESGVRSPENDTFPAEIPSPNAGLPTPDYAKLAGMSDSAIKAKTGCTWARWVAALDYAGAHTWPHAKIAEHVHQKYKVGDWWAQTVTVGYERIKGLRVIGQRRDGAFEASKSRTFPVPLARLYRAWSNPKERERWLGEPKLAVRTARANKSMRITWPDATSVEVLFYAKPGRKSQVAIQHRKLPDRGSGLRMKAFWAERLEALAAALGGKGGSA